MLLSYQTRTFVIDLHFLRYYALATRARALIPDLALSSDFISGFCGETEDDHEKSLNLIKTVSVDFETQLLLIFEKIARFLLVYLFSFG